MLFIKFQMLLQILYLFIVNKIIGGWCQDMLKLIIENSYTKVEGAQGAMLANIENSMAVMTPGAWYSPAYKNGYWDGKTRFFDKKNSCFPTGLLPQVLEIVSDGYNDDEFEVIDNRKGTEFMLDEDKLQSIILENSGKELRDYQVQSVNDVRFSELRGMQWQRGVLNLATNAGKTTIAEAIIQLTYSKLQEKWRPDKGEKAVNPVFMFVTHSKEIAYQAKKSIETDLGITCGLIGDGKWKVESVTIGIVSTLYSRYKNEKPEFIDLSKRVVAFVGDEIHHSTATSYFEILAAFNNASMRIGLTGTVEKDAVKKTRLYAITGEIITKISNNYLIKNNYSAKPECYMVPIDYPDVDKIRLYGRKDEFGELNYNDQYTKGIVSNMWRNYVIAKICEKEVFENNGQVLVLVDRLEHGECLEECFDYLDSDVRRMFLYGDLTTEVRQDGLNKLVNKEIDVLIATTILDEGVDVPNINAMIYARGGKSIRKLLQGVGRGLRKKADGSNLRIYDFIDDTAYVLIKQSQQRLEILQKEKFVTKKFVPENQLGITEKEFQQVMKDLDTTYDEKYVNVE